MAAQSTTPLLKVEGLKQYFRVNKNFTVKAVDDVSFEIYPGETYGLVGESGSGKSTIGRSIIRLYDPTAGKITFDGQDISGKLNHSQNSTLRTQMQMIFQDAGASFHPRRTIASSINDAFQSLMGKGAVLDLDTLCLNVGLSSQLAQRYPGSLSGGQCQRFAIARAIASSPKVLLCDEITSALDVSSQAQILALLSSLRKDKGMSIIFVSHDISVVSTLCDRMLVMRGGDIVEQGNTKSIISAPRNEYTKELIASVMEVKH